MRDDSGNVLFLILIAVALFAALSYAVTQSTRSGGGDASRETSLLNAATLSQYTSSLRAAIQRMVVGGTSITDLEFNGTSDFANCTSPSVCVFHPQGGGATYQNAPAALIDPIGDNPNGQWVFSLNVEVVNVGISGAGNIDGNDLVALLIGINKSVCEQINAKLGLPTSPLPSLSNGQLGESMIGDLVTYYMDNDYTIPSDEQVIGGGVSDATLAGKQEGCFNEVDEGGYVYYNVITER